MQRATERERERGTLQHELSGWFSRMAKGDRVRGRPKLSSFSKEYTGYAGGQ